MGLSDRIINALTSMIRMEDKVNTLSDAAKMHQQKLEELTGRLIRLETQLQMLTEAAAIRRGRDAPAAPPDIPRLPARGE